jgi:hypothetical protein
MSSKCFKISQEGTVGKRRHIIIMTLQKLEIIRRFRNGKSHRLMMVAFNE